jgi:hypothetical protein
LLAINEEQGQLEGFGEANELELKRGCESLRDVPAVEVTAESACKPSPELSRTHVPTFVNCL